jgi:hypothetical protein
MDGGRAQAEAAHALAARLSIEVHHNHARPGHRGLSDGLLKRFNTIRSPGVERLHKQTLVKARCTNSCIDLRALHVVHSYSVDESSRVQSNLSAAVLVSRRITFLIIRKTFCLFLPAASVDSFERPNTVT